jgi:hypothetical protein
MVAPVIATLPQGRQVTVADEAPNGWRFVQFEPGRAGYTQDARLQVTAHEPVVATRVVVASEPAPPPVVTPVGPPRLAKRLFLRPEMNIAYVGSMWDTLFGSVADASLLGATFGGNLLEQLSLEGTFGGTPGSGAGFMGAARYAFIVPDARRHALTFAAGPYAMTGGAYHTVVFAHAEMAYEYRGPVTFLVGYGVNLTFNDSAERVTANCGVFDGTCTDRFVQGDTFGHFRMGLGVPF